jgi:hypothetical protein
LVQDIRLASGATEADIMQALAVVESGGTVILPEGETIAISTGLNIAIWNRDITLDIAWVRNKLAAIRSRSSPELRSKSGTKLIPTSPHAP